MDEPSPGEEPEDFQPQDLPTVRRVIAPEQQGQQQDQLGQQGQGQNADFAAILQQFAESQHLIARILERQVGGPGNGYQDRAERAYTSKSKEVGEFEPTKKPDHLLAYNFLTHVENTCLIYTEERVMSMIINCFVGDVAVTWLSSLSAEDLRAVTSSLDELKDIIKRDFYLRNAKLRIAAQNEVFEWSQKRLPTEYLTEKIKLYRMTGETNEDGLSSAAELQSLMATSSVYSEDDGNNLAEYEAKLKTL